MRHSKIVFEYFGFLNYNLEIFSKWNHISTTKCAEHITNSKGVPVPSTKR
jgi:hypothetical protein